MSVCPYIFYDQSTGVRNAPILINLIWKICLKFHLNRLICSQFHENKKVCCELYLQIGSELYIFLIHKYIPAVVYTYVG